LRKILIFFILILLLASLANTVLAEVPDEPSWQVSLENSHLSGMFDYTLHYYSSDSSQVISKVSLPQNQDMVVLTGLYSFRNGNFIRLQYGNTDFSNKGRGSDSDWENPGLDEITSYGDMDFYGRQTILSIETGLRYIDNNRFKADLFMGYGEQSSTNEIRNVIYHLERGKDVGNRTQEDNGSSLDLKLRGVHFGTSGAMMITDNLDINLGLILSFWNMQAEGLWNNKGYDWVDNGNTIGYTASLGVQYLFTRSLSASAGYFYNYAKANGCTEVLDGSTLGQAVDLKYETQGYKLGIHYGF
jgi:hypothetical protein